MSVVKLLLWNLGSGENYEAMEQIHRLMKVQILSPIFEDVMKLHWVTPNNMKIQDEELEISSPGTWGNLNLLSQWTWHITFA